MSSTCPTGFLGRVRAASLALSATIAALLVGGCPVASRVPDGGNMDAAQAEAVRAYVATLSRALAKREAAD